MRTHVARFAARRFVPGAVAALTAAVTAAVTTAVPRGAATQPPSRDWRGRLLAEAGAVSFGAARPPVPRDSLGRPNPPALAAMRYAASRAPRGAAWVAGRITSRTAYPRLGISAGENYVWVVSGEPARMAIVPADARARAHWIVVRPHPDSERFCRADPTGSQFRFGADAVSVCVCVGGTWQEGQETGVALSAADARVLRTR